MITETAISNRPRKWWLACLLSLMLPGLGQIYNGQLKKGFLLFAFVPLWTVFEIYLVTLPVQPLNIITTYCVYAAMWLYAVIDAGKSAARLAKDYQLKLYNRWLFYLGLMAVSVVLGFIVIEKSVVDYYRMPAGSMEPTLLVGDYHVVDMFTYHFQAPKRGDVVVFKFPLNPRQNYIKRIIGIPGDTIEMKQKELFINGVREETEAIKHSDPSIAPGSRDNFSPRIIPSEKYFVMGDNRDNSSDSRFWGLVDRDQIFGRAKAIYWSWDSETKKPRLDRIGKLLTVY